MALIQKSSVIRLRVEPDLHEKMQQMADFHRLTISAMIRDWMYQQTARHEAARLRDQAKALAAPPAVPAPVPAPDTFELEKTPPKPSKAVAAKPKSREERRAEAKSMKAWEKMDKARAKKG